MQTTTDTQTVSEGDMFRCSWGYDQTNVDFYEVLSISASGKTVKVRQVQTGVIENDGMGGEKVAPIPGSVHPFNQDVLTKRVQTNYQGEPMLRIESYARAYLWDCTPAHQTASGWGH